MNNLSGRKAKDKFLAGTGALITVPVILCGLLAMIARVVG